MCSSRDSFFSLPASKSQISHPSDRSGHDIKYFWTNNTSVAWRPLLSILLYRLPTASPWRRPSAKCREPISVQCLLQSSCPPKERPRVLWTPGVAVERSQSNWVRLPKPTSFKNRLNMQLSDADYIPPRQRSPPKKMPAFIEGLWIIGSERRVPFWAGRLTSH